MVPDIHSGQEAFGIVHFDSNCFPASTWYLGGVVHIIKRYILNP